MSWTYCYNHFTVHVNQTIVLYALNWHSHRCHFSTKLGREPLKNKRIPSSEQGAHYHAVLEILILLRGLGAPLHDPPFQAPAVQQPPALPALPWREMVTILLNWTAAFSINTSFSRNLPDPTTEQLLSSPIFLLLPLLFHWEAPHTVPVFRQQESSGVWAACLCMCRHIKHSRKPSPRQLWEAQISQLLH